MNDLAIVHPALLKWASACGVASQFPLFLLRSMPDTPDNMVFAKLRA
jgi:hypothetical protein